MNAPNSAPVVNDRVVRIAMGLILVVMLLLAGLAIADVPLTVPPEWLTKWTEWILSAVGAIIAPNVLAAAATALRNFGNR